MACEDRAGGEVKGHKRLNSQRNKKPHRAMRLMDKRLNRVYDVRKNIADIIIAKHRNGPTGVIELFFNDNFVSFQNLEKRYEE